MKKIDFSDRMEAEKYFCGVVEQMRGVKVKAVFSCCPSFGDYDGIRRYIEDNEIYILFENDKNSFLTEPARQTNITK